MSQINLQTLDFSSLGFPAVGNFYLGVDVDGILKLRRSTDTLILSVTGSQFLQYSTITYADFLILYNTSSLAPGSVYLISDFRTSHYIQFTDSIGDGTGLGESVNIGPIEPLLVLATDVNKYDTDVKSVYYPDDDITWLHAVSDRVYDHFNNPSGVGRGHIIYRKSKDGNSRNYDFRSVVFWRWNDGSGNYTITRQSEAPNIFDYKVYKSFEEGFQIIKNNTIKSYNSNTNDYNYPYYLDNLVITTQSQVYGNEILGAFESTIDVDDFSSNEISLISKTSIRNSSSFSFNKIGYLHNSTIFTFSHNTISKIQNSSISNLNWSSGSLILNSRITNGNYNNFNSISSCTFSIFNSNNISSVSGVSVTNYSNNVSYLTKDQTEISNFNSGRILLSSNLEFNSLLGTFARVLTSNEDLVYSTSSSYITSTASGGFEPYFGIGTSDPLKKLNIHNSGILISGSQSEQLGSLGSSYSARFIIDTGSSTNEELLDFRNNSSRILYITASPSVSIGNTSSANIFSITNSGNSILTLFRTGSFSQYNSDSLNKLINSDIYFSTATISVAGAFSEWGNIKRFSGVGSSQSEFTAGSQLYDVNSDILNQLMAGSQSVFLKSSEGLTYSQISVNSNQIRLFNSQNSINLTGNQLTISTFSQDLSTNKFLVWDSVTGTVSYRNTQQLTVNDVNISPYTASSGILIQEYFGVSYSSTTYFNLPSFDSVENGKLITIKDESGLASVNPIIIQAGSGSIDGVTQSTLAINYGSLTLVKKSNGWWII